MLLRLLAKLVWGTTKFTVKRIVVPIAITAVTAIVMDELTKKVREDKPKSTGNGKSDRLGLIRPGP